MIYIKIIKKKCLKVMITELEKRRNFISVDKKW